MRIKDDFRLMRRGKQIGRLTEADLALLDPVYRATKKQEKALLLLHGFSSSPAVYRYLIPQIKHYDALICPVLPGHARSIEAMSQATAQDWRAAAHETCAELMQTYKKVDVLGLSLGGLIACELSQTFALNHLFLLAPALKLNMNLGHMIHMAHLLKGLGFRYMRNAAGNLLHNEHVDIAYKKLPISAMLEILRLIQAHQLILPQCPTDIFLGAQDEVVASTEIENLFHDMPNAHIHWLKNSAHVLPLDNDLEEIVRCVNQESLQ